MEMSDQTLAEFAVLAVTGIVVSAVAAIMVTDYRGSLTRYAHSCWRLYQRRWYQRLFLWTSSSRARYADETPVRRTLRLVAVLGLAMGVLVLAIEFAALVTGHVAASHAPPAG
jgi:multidrug efflux pump subunit AcrB